MKVYRFIGVERIFIVIIVFLGFFYYSEVHSQELNLGFERLDLNTGMPEGWNLKINAPDLVYGVDSLVKHSGKYSFHIRRSIATEKKSDYFQLSFPCAIPKGTLVKGGFYLKTKDIKSGEQLFLTLNFDNFCGGRSPEILSSDWEQYKVKMTTFFDVKNLVLSIGFSGVGELWIDDAVLEVNGKNILVRDSLFLCEIKGLSVDTSFIVSPGRPLKADETEIKWELIKLTDLLLSLPADSVHPHPASRFYPGSVSPDVQRESRSLFVNHRPIADSGQLNLSRRIRGNEGDIWYSTDVYAPPGEKLVVKIPDHLKGKLSVQIGAHRQRLLKSVNTIWKRMPCIFNVRALTASETAIANPFGGLVYLVYSPDEPAFSGSVEISGGISSPHYILGKTTDAEWLKMLDSSSSPWGEFETGTLIFTLPTEVLRRIVSPVELCDKWDRVLGCMSDLEQIPLDILRKQRIVTDVSLGVNAPDGWWAAGTGGYPIYLRNDKTYAYNSHEVILNPYDGNKISDDIMFYPLLHELGHNFQHDNWGFEGTTEVTIDLFALYVYDTVFKSRSGAGSRLTDLSPNELVMASDLSAWRKTPRLGFVMFQLLQKDFGWEPFRSVFGRFNADSMKGLVFSEQEKMDCWVLYLSEAVKKNLVPYFDKWGIKASDQVRRAVDQYPGWMPLAVSRY